MRGLRSLTRLKCIQLLKRIGVNAVHPKEGRLLKCRSAHVGLSGRCTYFARACRITPNCFIHGLRHSASDLAIRLLNLHDEVGAR